MLCVVVQVQAVLEEFYVNGDIQDVATTLEVDSQTAVAAHMTTLNPILVVAHMTTLDPIPVAVHMTTLNPILVVAHMTTLDPIPVAVHMTTSNPNACCCPHDNIRSAVA